ncbi:hypothetical protein BJ508DRAFT_417485 [Ascobolus immersus RN42]|uniref:BTB domain-containing protein n=1 Tax=Ascobolus immersus RN42 TaxID=1160509 RepID=A0A3N4HS93_ASCIM|nr:hypothetical protein BJ508DRAFT_417485 [Ascobolus immersus RN42]
MSNRITKRAAKGPARSRNSAPADVLTVAASEPRRTERKSVPDNKPAAFIAMLKSGKFSDLTLRVGGALDGEDSEVKEFRVHSFVLCSQSDFFAACLESGMKETEERVINLPEDRIDDIRRLLHFLYCGTYWEHPPGTQASTSDELYEQYREPSEPRTAAQRDEDPVMVNARMYNLGDKFGIPGLKVQVLKRIEHYISTFRLERWRLVLGEEPEEEPNPHWIKGHSVRVISGNWQRLLDALEEACEGSSEGADSPLAKALAVPIGQVVPPIWGWRDEDIDVITGKWNELYAMLGDRPEVLRAVFVELAQDAWGTYGLAFKEARERDEERDHLEHMVEYLCGHLQGSVLNTKPFQCGPCSNNNSEGSVMLPERDAKTGRYEWKCSSCQETFRNQAREYLSERDGTATSTVEVAVVAGDASVDASADVAAEISSGDSESSDGSDSEDSDGSGTSDDSDSTESGEDMMEE